MPGAYRLKQQYCSTMLSRRITDVDIENGTGARFLLLRDGWILRFDSILTWGCPMLSSEMSGLCYIISHLLQNKTGSHEGEFLGLTSSRP